MSGLLLVEDKRGQGIMLQIIIAIFIWIAGVLCIPLMQDIIDGARTGLNCAVPAAISDGTKLLCLVTDTGVIILIWTTLVVVVGLILGKIR